MEELGFRLDDFDKEILGAQERLEGVALRTPLVACSWLSGILGRKVYLKAENLQRTGSYKLRGAFNKIAKMNRQQLERGLITASAGNHAQGVGYAAMHFEVAPYTTVVMPESAPSVKQTRTRAFGVKVVAEAANYEECKKIVAERTRGGSGVINIPAFDDWDVIAGQATVAQELLEQLLPKKPSLVVVPVGGGGLLSGVLLSLKFRSPHTRVMGVESSEATPFVSSLKEGKRRKVPTTPAGPDKKQPLADGIYVAEPGEKTWVVVNQYMDADDFVVVKPPSLAKAMYLLAQREGFVAEGAGAVGVAAVLEERASIQRGDGPVVIILSGGNIDSTTYDTVMRNAELIQEGA